MGLWSGAVLVALALTVVVLHNRLVRARARVDEAWAHVAAQLQRRHDLVPNLVATVGAHARHERGALEEVTGARVAALTAAARDREAAEDELGSALHRLLAVSESYPELRADERFAHLQRELRATEDRLAFARGFANDRVRRHNELVAALPSALVARAFSFRPVPSFAVGAPEVGRTPAVELDR